MPVCDAVKNLDCVYCTTIFLISSAQLYRQHYFQFQQIQWYNPGSHLFRYRQSGQESFRRETTSDTRPLWWADTRHWDECRRRSIQTSWFKLSIIPSLTCVTPTSTCLPLNLIDVRQTQELHQRSMYAVHQTSVNQSINQSINQSFICS